MSLTRSLLRPSALKRTLFFLAADTILSLMTLYTAYLLRFNFHIPASYLSGFWESYLLLMPLKIAAMILFQQYRIVWRFYGLGDARRMLLAHLTAYTAFVVLFLLFRPAFGPFPRSVIPMDLVFSFVALAGVRSLKRLILSEHRGRLLPPVVLIGSSAASDALIRAARSGDLPYDPVAVVAEEGSPHIGSYIGGVKVRPFSELPELARRYPDLTAILSDTEAPRELDRLVEELERSGIRRFKRFKLIGDRHERLEDLSIEDLLARPPRDLDPEAIRAFVAGKRVLVTGAGGSIGSEICRQLLTFDAAQLLLVDNAEYNLYAVHDRLDDERAVPILLSITDRERLEEIFCRYRPEIVIHAAAYKHVPLCEFNPRSAVENNIVGAMNLLDLSVEYGVKKVVNISSDKAVRPTNVMGATKRVIELYAQNLPAEETEIVSVRFGNVLGSSGSVVPKFKAQIEAGGPVTVTHPEITRYFMLIPEACRLVLQAAAIARGGEVFVLDMGEPVKIVDLARRMIRLYGREGEIEIVYTGLRPGEKLYEELLIDEAEARTRYESIYVAQKSEYPFGKLQEDIAAILAAENPRKALRRVVPEYRPAPGEAGDR